MTRLSNAVIPSKSKVIHKVNSNFDTTGEIRTGKIAPHQNCEVRLVMAGSKPLGIVERLKDPYGYALAISMSNVGSLAMVNIPGHDAEVIVTKPHNQHLIGQYFHLIRDGIDMYGIKEYHRKLGKLFGYTDEDIEEYINSDVHCQCNKCNPKLNKGNFYV